MNEQIKFLKGDISNFDELSKNSNYFYLVNNNGNLELYLGSKIIAKSSTIEELNSEIQRAKEIENNLQEQIDNIGIGNIDLSDYYTKSETYSQSEVNELINGVETNVDLSNYYTKSETYSQAEIDDKFNNIQGGGSGDVDLSNYYSKTEVDQLIYNNITKVLNTPT